MAMQQQAHLASLPRDRAAVGRDLDDLVIFPENTASLAVRQRASLRVMGTRERIGRHHCVWRDVVLVKHRSPAIT